MNKWFDNDQCENIRYLETVNLDKCKDACKKDDRCSAVNFCKDCGGIGKNKCKKGTKYECILQKCTYPIPAPSRPSTGDQRGCSGHIVAGEEAFMYYISTFKGGRI